MCFHFQFHIVPLVLPVLRSGVHTVSWYHGMYSQFPLFSILPLPDSIDCIIKAVLVVFYLCGVSAWRSDHAFVFTQPFFPLLCCFQAREAPADYFIFFRFGTSPTRFCQDPEPGLPLTACRRTVLSRKYIAFQVISQCLFFLFQNVKIMLRRCQDIG